MNWEVELSSESHSRDCNVGLTKKIGKSIAERRAQDYWRIEVHTGLALISSWWQVETREQTEIY